MHASSQNSLEFAYYYLGKFSNRFQLLIILSGTSKLVEKCQSSLSQLRSSYFQWSCTKGDQSR